MGARIFFVAGWFVIAVVLSLGMIGATSSPKLWIKIAGAAFWIGLLSLWLRLGWKEAKSRALRGWGLFAFLILFSCLIVLDVLGSR
jgi:hypothetical protein